MRAWNPKINLVSSGDLGSLRARHIDDALALVPLVPPGTRRAIDLGSGGGLPGLVLAIATGITFDLVESDTRKSAFLREAARVTAAPAVIHNTRIEAADLPPDARPATAFTIHNLAFQGLFPAEAMELLDLPREAFSPT